LYDEDFLAELGEHETGDVGVQMGEGEGGRRLRSLDDTILLANLDRLVVISESMNAGTLLLDQNAKLTPNQTFVLYLKGLKRIPPEFRRSVLMPQSMLTTVGFSKRPVAVA
jgi:hypothetical protein